MNDAMNILIFSLNLNTFQDENYMEINKLWNSTCSILMLTITQYKDTTGSGVREKMLTFSN